MTRGELNDFLDIFAAHSMRGEPQNIFNATPPHFWLWPVPNQEYIVVMEASDIHDIICSSEVSRIFATYW